MKHFRRLLSMLAVLLMILGMTACASEPTPTESPTLPPQTAQELSDTSAFRTSADGSYQWGAISIRAGKITYYGVMYLPANVNRKLTTVIMCHGLNANCDGMGIMAKELVQYGYACYCPDFYGGSNLTKSGGKMKEMSILTEQRDLLAILEAIQKIDYVDTENIFLYGESLGGAVLTATAPLIQDQIQGVCLSYPAIHVPNAIRESYPVREEIPDVVNMGGCSLGKIFAQDVYDLDLYDEANKYSGPVLIQHGTEDTSVELSVSQKVVDCFPDAELIIYEGAGHGFGAEEFRVPTMKALSDFMEANRKQS